MAYCALHKATFSDVENCPHCEYDHDEEDCAECGGEGFIENDCFEDTCCCADTASHGFRPCPNCSTPTDRK